MATSQLEGKLPIRSGIVLLTVLLASLAYALLIGVRLEVLIQAVIAGLSFGMSVIFLYLFYRFVRAIERISREL